MAAYLNRVRAVLAAVPAPPGTPVLPEDMQHFTYTEANQIELALLAADRLLDCTRDSWVCSGETEAGGF